MQNNKNVFLFIDGSNLYAGQYELFGPDKYLDFQVFIKQIEKKIKVKFDKIYFYASYSPKSKKPAKKEKLYLKNEALFYRSVRNTKNVVFFKGYRSKTSGKEKEVDVKLAVDIVDFAHRNKYQKMFLISGDADFMEALFAVRRLDKPVEVVCLQNKVMFKSLVFFNTWIFYIVDKVTILKIRNIRRAKLVKLAIKEILRNC